MNDNKVLCNFKRAGAIALVVLVDVWLLMGPEETFCEEQKRVWRNLACAKNVMGTKNGRGRV